MATAPASSVSRCLCRLAARFTADLSDGQLLERFAGRHDEAAFAALVRRHGPLVLAVCRRVLRDWQASEDCFQATFVVLARKARSLRRPEALGPWLHGVACRTALKVRAQEARRRACERQAAVAEAVEPADGLVWRDLRPVLDEAVAELPEKFRVPVVLHHLQGLTVSEIARRLGCPTGTVAARLARGREQLRRRLIRRGLEPSAAVLGTVSPQAARAAVAASLARATVEKVLSVTARDAAGGAVSAGVAALKEGVWQVMSLTKFKITAAVLVLAGVVGLGITGGIYRASATGPGEKQEAPERGHQGKAAEPPREGGHPQPPYLIEAPDVLLIEGSGKLSLPEGIRGEHLVRPDGTIGLGRYGTVAVDGLTLDQTAGAIATHLKEAGVANNLSRDQIKRELKVEVAHYNSKVYYVITDIAGNGEQVYRFPITGGDTVLDAVALIDALPPVAGRCRIWVGRRDTRAGEPLTVLPVDWAGITQRGEARTNYTLRSGDRVYVRAKLKDQPVIHTVRVPLFKKGNWRSAQGTPSDPLPKGLDVQLTQAVIREIELKTPYKVVSEASAADTELVGTIVHFDKTVVKRNPLNEVRAAEVTLAVEVVWRDLRSGEILSRPEEPRSRFPLGVQPKEVAPLQLQSLAGVRPERGQSLATAREDVVRKMAFQIAGMMEKPW